MSVYQIERQDTLTGGHEGSVLQDYFNRRTQRAGQYDMGHQHPGRPPDNDFAAAIYHLPLLKTVWYDENGS
jgi:hypothetical protein